MAYIRWTGGGARLRHIDIRSDWMNLLRSREELDFASINIPGPENPADAHTKIFCRKKFKDAVAERMGRLPKFLCRLREPGDMSTGQNSDERADAAAEHTNQYTKASIVKY